MKKSFICLVFFLTTFLYFTKSAFSQSLIADFTADNTIICQGASITFTNTSTGTINEYLWNFGTDASISSATSAGPHTVNWTSIGTKTITLTVTGPGGSDTKTMTIENNLPTPGAVPFISGPSLVCLPISNLSYTVQSYLTNATYEWTVPAGATITSGNGTESIKVNFSSGVANGVILATVTGTSSCGVITHNVSLPITVNQRPNSPLISGPAAICNGAKGVVFSISNVEPSISYVWTVPVGVVITSGAGSSNLVVDFSKNASGGVITATPITSLGCEGIPASTNVSLLTPAPINAGPDISICQGSSFSVPGNTSSNLTYTWEPPLCNQNPIAFNTVCIPSATTTYKVTATDEYGCSSSDSVTVFVHPVPAVTLTASASVVCAGDPVVLTATATGTALLYQWENGIISSVASHTIFPTVTTGHTVKVYHPEGCYAEGLVTITAVPRPVANAGPDQTITTNIASLDGNIPTSGSGLWTLVSGTATITNPSDPKTSVTNLGSGLNFFRWTVEENSCTGMDDMIIDADIAPTTDIITGSQSVKYDSTYHFSVPFKSDETYEWTIDYETPFSAVIDSGQYTNHLYVSFYGPVAMSQATPLRTTAAGEYEVVVEITNPFGTKVVSSALGASGVTGLFGNKNENLSYSAYPNPFTDDITLKIISSNTEEVFLKIIDTKGRIVYTSSNGYSTNQDIHIKPELVPGIYEVHATSSNRISVFKIAKF